jgi:hypothetical protein
MMIETELWIVKVMTDAWGRIVCRNFRFCGETAE